MGKSALKAERLGVRQKSRAELQPENPDVAHGRPASDEAATIAAAQQDLRRFADLYEENFQRVYAYVARRVHDRHETQDLTADVFHQALANRKTSEWRGVPFAAWLFRIASNAITDRAKKAFSAKRAAIEQASASVLEAEAATEADDTEYRARLFKMVEGLPKEQHRVIVMRFAEDKKIAEIARALGRSEGAIKQLQFRALKNLRIRLGESNG
jgi:RNA polymerase sigma-70 factor, ECF subfamily